MKMRLVIGALLTILPLLLPAQENIPLGEWRVHPSYNEIRSVAVSEDKIFAAARNGILLVDRTEMSFTTATRMDVLSRSGVVRIDYDAPTSTLLVAYDDGSFDAIRSGRTKNVNPSLNTVITGPKEIHDVMCRDGLAYISTDYGVLVFDLSRGELKETWRDLGAAGAALRIFSSAVSGDSIFLATGKGVIAGNLNTNLLDFNNWKRMDQGDLAFPVRWIEFFDGRLYATIEANGLFSYENGAWSKLPFLENNTMLAVRSSTTHLVVTEGSTVWRIDGSGLITSVSGGPITLPRDAIEDANGNLWIADSRNGLVTDAGGSFVSIVPNGPAADVVHDLVAHQNKIFSIFGGYDSPSGFSNSVSVFENGTWTTNIEPLPEISSVSVSGGGNVFFSSFGSGVLDKTSGIVYDESNSTLVNVDPPGRGVYVPAIHQTSEGLWVANYGTYSSLHLRKNDGEWRVFEFPFPSARYPRRMLTDFEGNVWMLLTPEFGGGLAVLEREGEQRLLLTENDGSGELPSNAVYSIAIDRDGYIWAGTDAGVAYFYDESADAVKPIFENRFLLRDERVNAIAVDGGNRKWMGTERGVWLFDPAGERSISNYTTANSPLLSNNIIDVEINQQTGEVFFATERGIVSFRSDATRSGNAFAGIKIFPNPVMSNFAGQVGISGLATDAVVKITDVSGRLLFETRANGGTASWDVKDHNGRRVPTGVFLVYAVTPDGSESVVGKIAVIN